MKKILVFFVLLFLYTLIRASQNLTIEKVGEWGKGSYGAIDVNGNYAYCCCGSGGLDIIDIRNPGQPKLVKNYNTGIGVGGVQIVDNYAFLTVGESEVQIIDISNPCSPVLIGGFNTFFQMNAWCVKDNYFYGVGGSHGVGSSLGLGLSRLRIFDISNLLAPSFKGEIGINGTPTGIVVKGNYAYVSTSNYLMIFIVAGLHIIDISNPITPKLAGIYDAGYDKFISTINVKGNYAYLMHYWYTSRNTEMLVLDISEPKSPKLVNLIDIAGMEGYYGTIDIRVKDDYAYVAIGSQGLKVINISNPYHPEVVGTYNDPQILNRINITGNYAYVTQGKVGLKILDISNPNSPTLTGSLDKYEYGGDLIVVFVSGHLAYLVDFMGEFKIVDISIPASPALVGSYKISPEAGNLNDISVSGNYAYLTTGGEGFLYILDISKPKSPSLVGTYDPSEPLSMGKIYVSGNYAYIGMDNRGLLIIDISNPSSPTRKGEYYIPKAFIPGIYVKDHHAFLACGHEGLKIIDVSNPALPELVAQYNSSPVFDVVVKGKYAYVHGYEDQRLSVLDVSLVSSPVLVGTAVFPFYNRGMFVSGDYVYMACGESGLRMIDVSIPASLALVGGYQTPGYIKDVWADGNFIYAVDENMEKLLIFAYSPAAGPPRIHINRTQLTFAADNNGPGTGLQTISIANRGGANLNWQVSTVGDWLGSTPSAGMNTGEIYISIDSRGLSPGTYNGTLTVSDPMATNSPQVVPVTLNVYKPNKTSGPFGEYSTPVQGSIICSSVPFTGWVLDDMGIQSVQLFREEGKLLVYIGDAVLVEGARPDVEQAYPGYPMNYKAGWGYMMLTNFLPNGNGTFRIHAIAADVEGNQVTLGVKTVIVDNAHAVKPFGAIDTPTQGGTARGNDYVNFGWVLTPQPNTIPADGSTITAWVDGLPYGKPVYNCYRPDIAGLFPGYNNSDRAGGYLHLDTTTFENGVHTISWSVQDDAGNIDGIGSRYFTIKNAGGNAGSMAQSAGRTTAEFKINLSQVPPDDSGPIRVKKGYNQNIKPQDRFPDENGNITIEIKELERIEVQLFEGTGGLAPLSDVPLPDFPGPPTNNWRGFQVVGDQLRKLPIGSFLDTQKGVFRWQPGPGFINTYQLVFIRGEQKGELSKKLITVYIFPKFGREQILRSKE
jgi:hypothetical protein